MSAITIGGSVKLDIDRLMATRLLIQADSGGGKSWLLRRLAEQLFGKVQLIIIDPEGEFATLREKYGFVLVGRGGETPADPRSAALVAHKLLELRASAICDIYEVKHQARHQWVRTFLEAMIDIPKELWGRRVVVIVDEAHMFVPEKGKGESEAYGAMVDLCTRGRKRGYCAVFATQRLGMLSKDASSQLQNRLIGPTFEDINRKRAAEVLGVLKSDEREFFKQIQLLEPGKFFALGRAIAMERTLVKVGPVVTTHPEAGSFKHAAEPPPAPEAIAKLLPKLSDLPKAAEEKAKTEAELRREIRELKQQLKSQPAKPVEVNGVEKTAIERATTAMRKQYQRDMSEYDRLAGKMWGNGRRLVKLLSDLERIAVEMFPEDAPKFSKPVLNIPGAQIQRKDEEQTSRRETVRGTLPARPDANLNGNLTPYQRDILRGLAELEAIGKTEVPMMLAATAAGKSGTSSTFERYRSALMTLGYVSYPQPGYLALTEAGREQAGTRDVALDSDELQDRGRRLLTPYQVDLLNAAIAAYPEALTREQLGEKSSKQHTSSTFERYLSSLRTMEMIEFPRKGEVKAADWLFLE